MAHATHPAPPVAASTPARPHALVGLVARVTYPSLRGGTLAYLALTVVSRDIALMCVGAALSTAIHGRAGKRGTDGAQ